MRLLQRDNFKRILRHKLRTFLRHAIEKKCLLYLKKIFKINKFMPFSCFLNDKGH